MLPTVVGVIEVLIQNKRDCWGEEGKRSTLDDWEPRTNGGLEQCGDTSSEEHRGYEVCFVSRAEVRVHCETAVSIPISRVSSNRI